MTVRRAVFAAAAALLLPATVAAQVVRGVVVGEGDSPVAGVVVLLVDSASEVTTRALSDERGAYRLAAPRPGTYRLRTMRIGFRPATTEPFTLGAGADLTRRVALTGIPYPLAAVQVEGRSACRAGGDSAAATFAVWEQARTALTAAQLTASARVVTATIVSFERTVDPTGRRVLARNASVRSDYVTHPWRSLSPEQLRRVGYAVTERDGSTTYHAPDLDVLLSSGFAEDHCFRLTRNRDRERLGITFEPSPARPRRPGVARIRGTLWFDRGSSELRSMDFRYVDASSAAEEHAGGAMEFVRMRDGAWAIARWSIRMPALEYRVRTQQFGGTDTSVTEIRVAGGELALAMRAKDTVWAATPIPLSGVVLDARTAAPVPAARVSVVGTRLGTGTDGRGRFVMHLLPGSYPLEVRTPSLDSTGVAHPVTVTLADSSDVVELRAPTGDEVVAAVCGRAPLDAPGIVLGTVVMRGDPLPPRPVRVVVEWTEAAAGGDAGDHRIRWLEARTDGQGTFRLCGVPVNTPLAVRAEHDSAGAAPASAFIPPNARFARVVLTLDRLTARAALFTGIVLSDSSRRPLVGADVILPAISLAAATDVDGAFRLPTVPPGSHRVQVRRLGYAPLDTTLNFGAGQSVNRRIYLRRAVLLDSVNVIAEASVIPRSFDEHRRMGLGSFLTRAELAKLEGRPLAGVLADLPGMSVMQGTGSHAWVLTRRLPPSLGGTGVYYPERHETLQGMDQGCFAQVYVDDVLMNGGLPTEPFDIGAWSPDRIEAIEYYAGPSQTPDRYNKLESRCGVLVIWTRRSK